MSSAPAPSPTGATSTAFHDLGGGRSALEDVVDWAPPLGSLGQTFSGPFIQSTLERLFAFRSRRLVNDLDLHRRYPGPGLHVAITGSTGLIGDALVHFLRTGGSPGDADLPESGKGQLGRLALLGPRKGEMDGDRAGRDGCRHPSGRRTHRRGPVDPSQEGGHPSRVGSRGRASWRGRWPN
jgi:hypothetical protein